MGAESQEFDAEELLALAGHEFQRGEFAGRNLRALSECILAL